MSLLNSVIMKETVLTCQEDICLYHLLTLQALGPIQKNVKIALKAKCVPLLPQVQRSARDTCYQACFPWLRQP